MHKIIVLTTLTILFTSGFGISQNFPGILKGTWKLENKNTFEHWDLINHETLKGIVYKKNNENIEIQEYLDIRKKEDNLVYTATVLNQNQGLPVDFKLAQSDSIYSFENKNHDFPKFIRYKFESKNRMIVTIGDEKKSYEMTFHKTD